MTFSTLAQADLFADFDHVQALAGRRKHVRATEGRSRRFRVVDHEGAARLLDTCDDYRVLRRLRPRKVDASYRPAPGEFVAVIVDVETTGLDHRRDEVIEIGMVSFVHDAEGRIGPVIGALSMLREPSIEITPEITKLTGITAEMVAGQVPDFDAIRALVEPAYLVIAHNARFDRNFCERLHDGFVRKAWACSVAEVRWGDLGYEGSKLGYLVNQSGWFHHGHRAVDDCHALLEVLATDLRDGNGVALGHLLASSRRSRLRVWARHAPFDMKDILKRRGYRWNSGDDGRPKAWWTEIDEEALDVELSFLQREVYLREVELHRDVITAFDRYRA